MADVPLLGVSYRQPPSNIHLEQSLLGGIMHNARNLNDVAGFLKPEHFADPMHGRIFSEQSRRILDGGMADAFTLKAWFEQDADAGGVGGPAYLVQLITAYVGAGTSVPYAQEIHDAWMRRQLIAAGEDVVALAFGRSLTLSEIVSMAVARIDAALGGEIERRGFSLDEAMDAALQAADDARLRDGPAGLSTGFASVDEHMGGLEPATMTILAGRPGMGKSALAHQWAVAAARAGVGVLEVSLEMSARELGRRALAAVSGVPVWAMKRGRLDVVQAGSLVAARQELAGLPLTIEDGGGLTAGLIDLKARTARRKHGLGLILVDHLHIVRPEDQDVRQGATWAVGQISLALKLLAKRHNVPVLVAAQLNRGVEGRDDKRPGLADLRQAGDIEQNADVVSFIYRPEYYLKGEPEPHDGETPEKHNQRVIEWRLRREAAAGKAELIFAKVRDGATGTVQLTFDGQTTSFGEASP